MLIWSPMLSSKYSYSQMVILQNPAEVRTRWPVWLVNVMFYFASEPYATYLINNIHVLTQDSLLQIYFMLVSTLNIFSVKQNMAFGGGGRAVFSVWVIATALKRCLTVFLFTCIGLERHTPKSWVGPKQQITRIMHNVRFLTPVVIKDPSPGLCHVTMPKAYRTFRAASCLHLQDLCSPRTITWTLKMQHLWNAIPTDTPYLRRLASSTRWLISRFFAVIPQLPT